MQKKQPVSTGGAVAVVGADQPVVSLANVPACDFLESVLIDVFRLVFQSKERVIAGGFVPTAFQVGRGSRNGFDDRSKNVLAMRLELLG
jgi:hypothetical protein